MNELIKNWFRKVDIFWDVINQSGLDYDGVPWAKRFWKTTYRDARLRARIFDHSLNELVEFRNLGVLKMIWANSGNCIGRIRVNNLSKFNNNKIAKQVGFKDYAPNRILS